MLVSQFKQMSFACRSLIAREPSLWLLYQPYLWKAKLKRGQDSHAREYVVHSETELVIDGFQGSANTFATTTFKAAQNNNSVRVSHHLHSPAQVITAVNQNIPVLLTIREPEDAVISLTRRWPYVSVEQGLKGYIKFYQKLLPYRKKMVVSTFESTTKRLNDVIENVNKRFNTSFDSVDLSQASQARATRQKKSKQSKEEVAALKNLKRKEMSDGTNKVLLEKANDVYRNFLEA